MNKIKIGKYEHYKGKQYQILRIAKHSETLDDLVIYKALYKSIDFGLNQLWARPIKEFFETIEKNGEKT